MNVIKKHCSAKPDKVQVAISQRIWPERLSHSVVARNH
jgi:hypothetical protein